MTEWSDEDLLVALRRGDDTAVQIAYDRYYPMIFKLVLQQNGTEQDAEDLFHDMLEVILIQRSENTPKLYSSLSTYLYAICKNQWHKNLRKRRYESKYIAMVGERDGQKLHQPLHDLIDENHRKEIYERHLAALDPRCRKLLELMMEHLPLDELTLKMGYTSTNYVKKLKHQCREKLRKSIQQDPEL
jgi:RNA polymerase sigma factor (sigma-70 family)